MTTFNDLFHKGYEVALFFFLSFKSDACRSDALLRVWDLLLGSLHLPDLNGRGDKNEKSDIP
ncbi:hypothetical protein DPMN_062890 [Dreissena polymorpha]|uniref:Uncharacterized protein n=1 Tax=Dreissena polymorpha TaxID=45954 RepID=A0A9D4CAE8_DREPO|nr:hypothetical protein DPMN_062890 [Dreissena polymorpha]